MKELRRMLETIQASLKNTQKESEVADNKELRLPYLVTEQLQESSLNILNGLLEFEDGKPRLRSNAPDVIITLPRSGTLAALPVLEALKQAKTEHNVVMPPSVELPVGTTLLNLYIRELAQHDEDIDEDDADTFFYNEDNRDQFLAWIANDEDTSEAHKTFRHILKRFKDQLEKHNITNPTSFLVIDDVSNSGQTKMLTELLLQAAFNPDIDIKQELIFPTGNLLLWDREIIKESFSNLNPAEISLLSEIAHGRMSLKTLEYDLHFLFELAHNRVDQATISFISKLNPASLEYKLHFQPDKVSSAQTLLVYYLPLLKMLYSGRNFVRITSKLDLQLLALQQSRYHTYLYNEEANDNGVFRPTDQLGYNAYETLSKRFGEDFLLTLPSKLQALLEKEGQQVYTAFMAEKSQPEMEMINH